MALTPVTATLLAAFTGVLGIALGAWLNSHLTTRRERWNLKRDVYVRLLEHLHEARVLLRNWIDFPATDRSQELAREVEQIRRAGAVAALLVDRGTFEALEALEVQWTGTRPREAGIAIEERVRALRAAYQNVLAIARRDLGL